MGEFVQESGLNEAPKIGYEPSNLTSLGTKRVEIKGQTLEIHNIANFPTVWRFIFKYKAALATGDGDPVKAMAPVDNLRDLAYASVVVENWHTLNPAVAILSEEEQETYCQMMGEAQQHNKTEDELAAAIKLYGYSSGEVMEIRMRNHPPEAEHDQSQYQYSQLLDKFIPIIRRINPAFDIDSLTR
jgi:hypothetical protein